MPNPFPSTNPGGPTSRSFFARCGIPRTSILLHLPGSTSKRLASLAREALIAEAELTPKPGLVDRRGSGAHHEVIEQESGIEEFDASDRGLIWAIHGGEQRVAMGVADELVLDDAQKIAAAVHRYVKAGLPQVHRSRQVELYRRRIAALDTSRQIDPLTLRQTWARDTKEGGSR